MVNEREKEVAERYEEEGWTPVRCGAPDWLMVKVKNGEITSMRFVEVKSPGSYLSYEQGVWKQALQKLGGDFTVEVVE